MNGTRIVAFDFETTGVDPKVCRPIEFAAVVINPDGSRDEVGFFIKNIELKPGIYASLPEEITRITNITDADLLTGILMEEAVQKIADVFDYKNSTGLRTVIVGHNIIRFDIPIAQRVLLDHGIEFSPDTANVFDTGGEYKATLMNESKKPDQTIYEFHKRIMNTPKKIKWNLTAACEYYGVQMKPGAHRAIVDVAHNIEVFLVQVAHMKVRLKQAEEAALAAEATKGILKLF